MSVKTLRKIFAHLFLLVICDIGIHNPVGEVVLIGLERSSLQSERRGDVILLENGSTERIQTLDDFLDNINSISNNTQKNQSNSNIKREKDLAHHSYSNLYPRFFSLDNNKDSLKKLPLTKLTSELEREEEILFGNNSIVAKIITENTSQLTNHSEKQTKHEHPAEEHQDHKSKSDTNQKVNTTGLIKPIPQHWQVKSLLNVSHDYPLAYSQIICGYVWPLMAAITLFTNLMIVFVLTQRDMRTPTNVVLTSIAIADIIPIVVPVPWFVYLFALGYEKQVLYPPVACYFYQHSTRSISEIFYFLSTWLNVLLAIQDYLVACQPKLAKKYCKIKVVVLEIISLTLLAFLLNLPQALKLVYKPVKFYYNGQLTWGCRALQAKWFKDLVGEYVAVYDDVFTAIIVLFVDGGPAILLITLTALLINQLHKQRIQGHYLMEQARTASKRRRERHRQQEYEASARVMIFVLLAFLAVKIPFATTYSLMIIQSRFDIRFVENFVDFQKAITLTDLVFVLSYPINFTIFCSCSKKFRHKCAELLSECNYNAKTTRDRWMSSFSGSFASDSVAIRTDDEDKRDSMATINGQLSNEISEGQRQRLIMVSNMSRNRANDTETDNSYMNDIARSNLGHLLKQESLNTISRRARMQKRHEQLQTTENLGEHNFCEGLNHPNLGEAQLGQMRFENPDIKALIAEGKLCLECIAAYERLRNSQSSLGQQDQQTSQNPCLSVDSTSWSMSIPPPPPPIDMEKFSNLPNIVTTRWESIREIQDLDAEENEELTRMGLKPSHSHSHEERTSCSSIPMTNPIDTGTSGWMSSTSVTSVHSDNLTYPLDKTMGQTTDYSEQSAPPRIPQMNLNQKPSDLGSMGKRLKWPPRSGKADQYSRGNSRVSSDPGVTGSNFYGSLKPREDAISTGGESTNDSEGKSMATSDMGTAMRSSETQAFGNKSIRSGSKRQRHNMLGQIDQRQRSLSLSNSNLSTLSNATGILADIFVSTLLNAEKIDSSTGPEKDQSSEYKLMRQTTSSSSPGRKRSTPKLGALRVSKRRVDHKKKRDHFEGP